MDTSQHGVTRAVAAFWDALPASAPGFGPDCAVVVGLSGGPDSLALWDALFSASIHPRERLIAACLDHGIRPEAADEAAALQRHVTEAGGVFQMGRADVPAMARDEGLSMEEAARVARYRFLARVARDAGARFVAVGHNADDQAETVLMHFLRGSGLAGLRGMLPNAPLPGDETLRLLRPLLTVTRADILDYCGIRGLAPVYDTSNLDKTFFRNRLRHEVLPSLEAVSTGLAARLRHMAAILAGDEEMLADRTAAALSGLVQVQDVDFQAVSLGGWRALPLGLRRRVLRAMVGALSPGLRDVSFETVELAREVAERGHVGQRATLPAGMLLTVGYDSLTISRQGAILPLTLPQLASAATRALDLPGFLDLDNGWRLVAIRDAAPDLDLIAANADPWRAWVGLPASAASLDVRPRRPGESLRPLGLKGRRATLKALMINRKVPAAARPLWPIVALPAHAVWVTGHVLDERAAVKSGSRNVWQLRCERVEIAQ